MDQLKEFSLCGEEDWPFFYPLFVRRVPEPDCNARIRFLASSLSYFGWRTPVRKFEWLWWIVGDQTIAWEWKTLLHIPAGGLLVIWKSMADAKDSD
jgi:hypothetical protein